MTAMSNAAFAAASVLSVATNAGMTRQPAKQYIATLRQESLMKSENF